MRKDFLEKEEDLMAMLKMGIGEASAKDAQEEERRWMLRIYPDVEVLQRMMYEVYKFPRPLSVENFTTILERLGLPR